MFRIWCWDQTLVEDHPFHTWCMSPQSLAEFWKKMLDWIIIGFIHSYVHTRKIPSDCLPQGLSVEQWLLKRFRLLRLLYQMPAKASRTRFYTKEWMNSTWCDRAKLLLDIKKRQRSRREKNHMYRWVTSLGGKNIFDRFMCFSVL